MKDFIKKHKGIITSIILTVVIMLILYAVNDLYPFGKNIFGLKDFDHAYIPVYYKLWDVLHGVGTPLFDWNLGAGVCTLGSLIMNSLIFPTSLVIGLVPRSFVPNMMGIIMILKLVTITCTTYYVLNKLFNKVDDWYKVVFTLLYTFSGWMLYMISNILYLDVVAIFPLFVLAYYSLLKDNKWVMYYITLTLCLLSSYYMSWTLLFFLFGCTPLALLILDLEDKKKKAVEVVILTLTSLFTACVLFLPSFYQTMTSTRMTTSTEPYYSMGVFLLKVTYLFPMAIPIFYTIKQFFVKKDKKINLFFGSLLLYLLIGIVLEPINRMWHTGSYSGFPFRYSYIPCFILILASMWYLSNNKEKSSKKGKNDVINAISAIITTGIFITLAIIFKKEIASFDYIFEITKYSQFFGLLLLFIISIATTFIINKCHPKIKPILLIILVLTTTLTYNLYFFEPGEQTSTHDQELKDNLNLVNDNYNYADYTGKLSINYPYILQVQSNENRIHIIHKEIKDMYEFLGYYYYDTFLYSYGGTIFSDMLLHNKYIFTKDELNESLYQKIDEYKDIKLYVNNYNADYLIPYNGKIYNEENFNTFDNQNNIYKELFDKDEDIIKMVELKDNTITLEPNKIYYITYGCIGKCNRPLLNENIMVQKEYQNDSYNLELYSKEKEEIEIDIKEFPNIEVRYIDINEFTEFVSSLNQKMSTPETKGNKRTYQYEAEEDTSLLIPINYDESFNISINGEKTSYTKNVYNMISVDVKKGKNTIVLEYVPKFKKEGLLITIITIILVLVITKLNKKLHILDRKFILYPLFFISCLICILFILKVYILTLF